MATRPELYSRPVFDSGDPNTPASISRPASAMPLSNTQPKWGKNAEEGLEAKVYRTVDRYPGCAGE